jgi:hypothetical protein
MNKKQQFTVAVAHQTKGHPKPVFVCSSNMKSIYEFCESVHPLIVCATKYKTLEEAIDFIRWLESVGYENVNQSHVDDVECV